VKVVSDQEVFDCPDLYSTQEEADTRMILQALHADKRLKNWESKTDFQMNRQCNTDFQGALMGYFD
jgi:uncharacterized protein YbaA (DUF1428 family)